MVSRIERVHAKKLKDGSLKPDPGQAAALKALARLEKDLKRRGLFGGVPEVRGVYLYGPPGRGKSMLMDLFFANVQEPRKTRAHFHAFLSRVHALMRNWREGDKAARKATFGQWKGDDPIGPVAALIASEARLLCFDELQVTDIADALILGRLFRALFEHKVVLAVTSNRRPEDLYLNGVNRELFVPFIDIIEARCERIEVAGSRDWRIDTLASAPAWYDATDAEGGSGCAAMSPRSPRRWTCWAAPSSSSAASAAWPAPRLPSCASGPSGPMIIWHWPTASTPCSSRTCRCCALMTTPPPAVW